VDEVTLRVQRYLMEDGLFEIQLGLIMAVLSGLFFFRNFMFLRVVEALSLAVVFSISWGFKKLKERITFPRRGYVALPQPTTKRWISVGLLMFVAFDLALRSLTSASLDRIAVPGSAVSLALALVLLGLQARLQRMIWEGVLTLVFGAFLYWFTDLKGSRGVMALMVMAGASIAIIGAFRFGSFLKANPRPQETEA
jgi:hypothetical protein